MTPSKEKPNNKYAERKKAEKAKRGEIVDPAHIPGIGYYLLRPDDKVLPGDEFRYQDKDVWAVTNIAGGALTAGSVDKLIYRRPITHESIMGKFHRPLKVGEQIEPGDQFWDSRQQEWKNSSAVGMDYTSSTIGYRRPLKNEFNTMLCGYEVISTPYMWGLLRAAGEDITKIAALEERVCVYYRFGKLTPSGNWRESHITGTKHNGKEHEAIVSVKFIDSWHSYFVKENPTGFMQLVFIEKDKDQPTPTPPPSPSKYPITSTQSQSQTQ